VLIIESHRAEALTRPSMTRFEKALVEHLRTTA
jgi:hypothetical protein